MSVDTLTGTDVLIPKIAFGTTDDGKQIGRLRGPETLDNTLHGRFPKDAELTMRLLTAIGEATVRHIALPQKGHINKGHAPGVEREKEEASGKVGGRTCRQRHALERTEGVDVNGTLDGL